MSRRNRDFRTNRLTKSQLTLEALEERDVPAVAIQVNYSMDLLSNGGSGFFQKNPAAVTVMNQVAVEMGERISANLSAIDPSGANTWTASFYSPETGAMTSVVDLNVAANTIVVFVGAHAMGGGELGYGATGGYSMSGYANFFSTVETRNWSSFAADDAGIWGGSIQFSTNANWYFGLNPNGLQSNQIDFYSVATHELGHVLGAGTSPQWMPQVSGTNFYGKYSDQVYGGPVPLASASDLGEWANGLTINGKLASEGPTIPYGTRVTWTMLDEAALEDVGWHVGVMVSPPVAPPPVSPPPVSPVSPVSPPPVSPPPVSPVSPPVSPVSGPIPVLAAATAAGTTTVLHVTYSNGTSYSWDPFGSTFTGGATVALGDVNDDGIPDIVVASGPSGTALSGTVQVYDGSNRQLIASYTPLGSFGGGLDVAVGDLNGDGHADIIVGVEGNGSPLVTVINGATGATVDQFLAYSSSFSGGVRVAAGDLSDSGPADVLVAPGSGAYGMLVKAYGGTSIMAGNTMPQYLGAMQPFPNYTGALTVAVGKLTADSVPDILIGTQSYSEKFAVYSGQSLSSGALSTQMFTQIVWSNMDVSGINLALVPDSSGNGLNDIVVTDGTGNQTARYLNSQFTSAGWSTAQAEFFTPIPGVNAPVFVG